MSVRIDSTQRRRRFDDLACGLTDARKRAGDQIGRRLGSGKSVEQMQNSLHCLYVVGSRGLGVGVRRVLERRRSLVQNKVNRAAIFVGQFEIHSKPRNVPGSGTTTVILYEADRPRFDIRHLSAKKATAACNRDFTVPSGISSISLICL
jgi:hypothetical protein